MASNSAPKMEYTRLGNSGLKISKVIYGAMSFGAPDWQEWVIDEAAALPLLKVRR
jgi:aryl-alcohol dehydrogenase-like predicted oxidoreductase